MPNGKYRLIRFCSIRASGWFYAGSGSCVIAIVVTCSCSGGNGGRVVNSGNVNVAVAVGGVGSGGGVDRRIIIVTTTAGDCGRADIIVENESRINANTVVVDVGVVVSGGVVVVDINIVVNITNAHDAVNTPGIVCVKVCGAVNIIVNIIIAVCIRQ